MSLIGATHGFHIFKNSRKTPLKFEHHSRFLIASFHRARGQENPVATETYAPLPIAPYLARMVNERPDRGPIIFEDVLQLTDQSGSSICLSDVLCVVTQEGECEPHVSSRINNRFPDLIKIKNLMTSIDLVDAKSVFK